MCVCVGNVILSIGNGVIMMCRGCVVIVNESNVNVLWSWDECGYVCQLVC